MVEPSKTKKNTLKLEARDVSIALTCKAFSWMQESFLRPKKSTFTASSLALGLKPSIDDSMVKFPWERLQ